VRLVARRGHVAAAGAYLMVEVPTEIVHTATNQSLGGRPPRGDRLHAEAARLAIVALRRHKAVGGAHINLHNPPPYLGADSRIQPISNLLDAEMP
jgi:hypothetical protein